MPRQRHLCFIFSVACKLMNVSSKTDRMDVQSYIPDAFPARMTNMDIPPPFAKLTAFYFRCHLLQWCTVTLCVLS